MSGWNSWRPTFVIGRRFERTYIENRKKKVKHAGCRFLMKQRQALPSGLAGSTQASRGLKTRRTRTRRFVTNVTAEKEANGLLLVRSNLLLFRSRSFTDETILVGCREDKWSSSDKWLLSERKILIDHCTVENMSLLL